jgi:aryl-alcohol dehydrogenase-like predicted oxidoreductase
VVAYTATRWGTLLDPRHLPAGEPVPRASDCYRFALGHAGVDVCLAGPSDAGQLDEALAALDRGPLADDELAWLRRVGAHVHQHAQGRGAMVGLGDRALRLVDRLSHAWED